MNTLDELRRTLDRRASGLADPAVHIRPVAVRERVRVVRRRRQAVAGVAAAVAVAAVVTAVTLPSPTPPQPADPDRTLNGMTAPKTLTSLGYTYAFAGGVESAGDDAVATLELAASDVPRLVSWGAPDDDTVRLAAPGGRAWVSTGPDFTDFTYVPPGQDATYRVRAAEAAAAVYELSDAVPAGVTRDGITFREDVADEVLVGAGIGAAGETEVTATVPVVEGDLRLKLTCLGEAPAVWLETEIDGQPISRQGGRGSCQEPVFDPGGSGTYTTVDLTEFGEVGDAVTFTLRMTAPQEKGVPLVDPSARLGFGLYRATSPRIELAGTALDRTVESGGHTYRYVTGAQETGSDVTVDGLSGLGSLRLSVVYGTTDVPRGVSVEYAGTVHRPTLSSRGGVISLGPIQGTADDTATLTFRGGTAGPMGLAVFERID